MAQNQSPSLVGQQVGPYKIHSLLGVGGMGEVYLAQDPRLDRTIALKILPTELASDPDRIRRFIREARAASGLKHPNVATIYEIGKSDEFHFIAMEYVEGRTLADKISGHPLPIAEIVDIGLQVADALDEAHRKGITHRDIKPANLMLTSREQVKILDFGLAKVTRPEGQALGSDISTVVKTETGAVMGTVQYMSPEQVLGKEVDHRTDIFSLGVVLYEMATGRLPFTGTSSSETMDRILHGQPEAIARFNYDVPAELDRIIRKCLEKDRERRYQSARELLTDLRNLKRDSESSTRTVEGVEPRPRSNVRNVAAGAIALAIAALLGITVYLFMGRGKPIDSMAVMPFLNASADLSQEYLSDGITESLINSLSQLPNLKVLARTTVFSYKNRAIDPIKVGRELGVRAVLTGRVVERGGTLIIQADLLDVTDGSQLWGEQYHRKLSDVLAVQEEIAKQISERLRLKLTGEDQKRLTRHHTENAEAYQLYLKGCYYWNKRTAESLNRGIEYFQQAIDKDPNYALAYAGLIDSYSLLGSSIGRLSPRETFSKAKAAAVKALDIDDTLAEAHAALALVILRYDWDWPAVEREIKRAIQLNPNYATTYQWYADYLVVMGRLDETIAQIKRAQELDPLSLIINTIVGLHLYQARQYDQAIEQCQKTLEMDPNFAQAHLALGMAYEQKARYEEAIAALQKATTLSPSNPFIVSALGHAYAVSGQPREAMKILHQLQDLSQRRYISPHEMAIIYAGLGEKDQAFAWLEKAYADRVWRLPFLKVEPRFDSLRSDPRFQDLLRRMKLAL
jgi:serine/threonine protein kinase/Tfp pilus assembly protein PilF